MKGDSKQLRALLATIVCHALWGLSFLASRRALSTAHMLVLLSHRFLIAFLVMNGILLLSRTKLELRGKRLWLPVLLGLCEPVIYFLGEQYGILHSNTIFSGVMIAMIPIVSTVAAAPVLREKPTLGQVLFSLLSVGGVVGVGLMSSSAGALEWGGAVALVVAVLSAAAYTLLSRGISETFSPFARTYVMIGVGAAVFTVLAAVQCRGSAAVYLAPFSDVTYLLSVLFLALGCSVLCYFLSSYALTNLPVARESVFSNLTTVVSVFAGAVFLREPFTWFGAVMILLILAGIWGVQRTAKK